MTQPQADFGIRPVRIGDPGYVRVLSEALGVPAPEAGSSHPHIRDYLRNVEAWGLDSALLYGAWREDQLVADLRWAGTARARGRRVAGDRRQPPSLPNAPRRRCYKQ